MNIGIFVCANGLGHIRRVSAILHYLLNIKNEQLTSVRFTIHFPVERTEYLINSNEFKYLKEHRNVFIKDFRYPVNYYEHSLAEKTWSKIKLPQDRDFQLIWSDNITQVLELGMQTVFTGSFFWHEVLEQMNHSKNFVNNQRVLISQNRPIMIGNEYFSTPDVRQLTDFSPVGFYKYNIIQNHLSDKKDILLSAGLGGESLEDCSSAIKRIIQEKLVPPRYLWIEPRLYEDNFPDWVKLATYQNSMFSQCYASCIRPGIGTLSDALLGGNYIFSFHKDTHEMNYNSSVLDLNGFGERTPSPYDAYSNALELYNDKEKLKITRLRTAHLRSDGVSASAEKIWSVIKNKLQ